MRRVACAFVFVSLALLDCTPARAQGTAPPGPFVIDARGGFSSVGRSEELAAPRGLQVGELPKRVLGVDVGAHIYPVRGTVTLGVGASFLWMSGSQTPGVSSDGTTTTVNPGHFAVRGLVPQLSLNFGSQRGWSYLGGGLGLSQMKVGNPDRDLAYSPQLLTLNVGGGARWFISEHVAFTFDGRYYRLGSKELSADYIGNPATSLFVLSAGFSFR